MIFELEIDPGSVPVSGRVRDADTVVAFVGLLELLAVLDRLIGPSVAEPRASTTGDEE